MAEEDNWKPLSQRDSPGHEETLFEGVPDHLDGPLTAWTVSYLELERARPVGALAQRVALRLRIRLADLGDRSPEVLVNAANRSGRLLDVVDTAVHLDEDLRWDIEVAGPELAPDAGAADWLPDVRWPSESLRALAVDRLDQLLTDAGSAYMFDWRRRCLVRRVDPTVSAAVEKVMANSGEPGEHLQAAWNAIYGLHPDPTKGYDEAVRAVEAAAIPVVLPKGTRETLGKVRAHLRDASSAWELAVEGKNAGAIDPLVSMIGLLWEGHTRHAGSPDSRRQRQDEAEMAVHLATTLVQWFTSGAIRKRSTAPSS